MKNLEKLNTFKMFLTLITIVVYISTSYFYKNNTMLLYLGLILAIVTLILAIITKDKSDIPSFYFMILVISTNLEQLFFRESVIFHSIQVVILLMVTFMMISTYYKKYKARKGKK